VTSATRDQLAAVLVNLAAWIILLAWVAWLIVHGGC
jgi:hypothetical protein